MSVIIFSVQKHTFQGKINEKLHEIKTGDYPL